MAHQDRDRLRQTWTALQRAETLLFQAAAVRNKASFSNLFEGVELEEPGRGLLIRMACGLDTQRLTPQDYLNRYPFSSAAVIQDEMNTLASGGYLSANGDRHYQLTHRGQSMVRQWMGRVGTLMQSLALEDFSKRDVRALLAYDRRIIAGIEASFRPHGSPIFRHRLRGLHPCYDPPALWHHWQYVWTLLAASEDEEEFVRWQRGIPPLVWFARRQLWFRVRRPWRMRVFSVEDLAGRAAGYSPLLEAETACRSAVNELIERGWAIDENGRLSLTARGLAACDADETIIETYFLRTWPPFENEEVDKLNGLVECLTAALESLLSQQFAAV